MTDTVSPGTSEESAVDSLLLIAETSLDADSFRPLGDTLDHICEYVRSALGCRAVLVRIRSDDDQLVVGGHSTGIDDISEYQGLGDATFSQNLPGQRNPSVEVFSTGQPRYVLTAEYAEGSAGRKRLERMGAVSMYFAPIAREGAVIGVLNCYWADEHTVTPEEAGTVRLLARLTAVSLVTATIADNGERLRRGLEDVHSRLQEDNSQLRHIHLAQSRMISLLADQSALTVEQTARLLASSLKRSVLVVGADGEELALEAERDDIDKLRAVAREHSPLKFGVPSIPEDGDVTLLRIDGGPGARPAGLIALTPRIGPDEEFDQVVAKQAALVIGAHVQARSANSAMANHALPMALLAMSRGLLNASQLKEMRALLEVGTDTRLGLAIVSTPTPEAAVRLSRRPGAFSSAGWPVMTAVADGADVLVLLRGSLPARASALAVIDRLQEVICIGVSSLADGVETLESRLGEARMARGIASSDQCVAFYDDFGAFVDVTGSMSIAQVREFVLRTLGDVQRYDEKRDAGLVKTLKAWVEHSGQAPEAAAELSVHVNTLHKRLARIEELSGLNLRSYRDMARVLLALDLLPVVESQSAE
ncbi:helix-turn-helix domain-containing protein [Leucobacter sp. wl10]|uniref:helix-turn-helix domain-containing protein n=1 Tax=Leucobacter sp. wl10 TaxID=2304677 RepID=UPI000E5AAEAD|nr:helix-turn-helix domain-containing protein [Leucobacter sp. wl10]RGE20051.1 GAF domain-containing protein [Leucobacter sp. wl10]